MAVNLATKYSAQLDERFKGHSYVYGAFRSQWDAEFIGAETVKIYTIDTAPMNDYNVEGGLSRYGTPNNLSDTVQELKLEKKRSFTYTIDNVQNLQQLFIKKVPETLARQIDEKVIPEFDAHFYAKVTANAHVDNIKTETLTKDNVYEAVLDANIALDNAFVPREGRVLYVTGATLKALKLSADFIKNTDLAQGEVIFKGQVGMIDGVRIVLAQYPMGEGINFVLLHGSAIVSPIAMTELKVHEKPQGVSGALVEGLFVYDTFVLAQKTKAIYVSKAGE